MIADLFAGYLTVLTGGFSIVGAAITGAVALLYTADALTPLGEIVLVVVGVPTAFASTNWIIAKVGGLRKVFSGSKK